MAEVPSDGAVDAPYPHTLAAVRCAWRLHANPVLQRSSVWDGLRGGTVKGPRPHDTIWDAHAQAGLVYNALRDKPCRRIFDLAYSPDDGVKARAAYWYYGTDWARAVCALDWGGAKLRKGWMKTACRRLGISRWTLWRVKLEVGAELDRELSEGLALAEKILRQRGLVRA